MVSRRQVADPSTWRQNINKKLRREGKPYEGFRYDKNNKVWLRVQRPAKKMRPPCRKVTCEQSNNRHCSEFSYEDCRANFDYYWGSGDAYIQDSFLRAMVEVNAKARSTLTTDTSRRMFTRKFYLKKNNEMLQVCKNMFLNTLDITNSKVDNILSKQMDSTVSMVRNNIVLPRNPRPSRGFTWDEEDKKMLSDFIESIPKAPPSYQGADPTKIYLAPDVSTFTQLHMKYKKMCEDRKMGAFSICTFSKYFKEHNYALMKTTSNKEKESPISPSSPRKRSYTKPERKISIDLSLQETIKTSLENMIQPSQHHLLQQSTEEDQPLFREKHQQIVQPFIETEQPLFHEKHQQNIHPSTLFKPKHSVTQKHFVGRQFLLKPYHKNTIRASHTQTKSCSNQNIFERRQFHNLSPSDFQAKVEPTSFQSTKRPFSQTVRHQEMMIVD